jgi:hypothetical protein
MKMRIISIATLMLGFAVSGGMSEAHALERWENLTEVQQFGDRHVPRWLADTVVRAAQATGVNPTYMLALADKESSFSFRAKASTSSAAGLYQFIEGTWLGVLKEHAGKHGYGAAADAISLVAGRPVVTKPEDRRWILSLREDPYLSALMACEAVKDSREQLSRRGDRAVSEADLYLAHFLGSAGAARLLRLIEEKPDENAPKAFQAAARANKSVFYVARDKKQEGATVAEVHARISAMMASRVAQYASAKAKGQAGLAAGQFAPL